MAKQKVSAESENTQLVDSFELEEESSTTLEEIPINTLTQTTGATAINKEPMPDESILNILRIYPSHASLFIDNHGGFYTLDTPAYIRANAVLYKNPYHKP